MPMSIIEAIKKSADYIPANTVIYRVNGGLERLYYSQGIPSLSGYTREEFVQEEQKNAMGLLFPPDKALVENKLSECIEKKTGANFVYRLSHKTKGYIWVHAITKYIGAVEGYPVIVANLINVSSEMMANSLLLESSDRMIALIDRHSRDVLYVNQAFLKEINASAEDCLGRPCDEIIRKMGLWDETRLCLKLRDGNEEQTFEGPDGRVFSMRCTPVSLGEHEAAAYFIEDITQSEMNLQRIEKLQSDIIARYRQQLDAIMKMNPDAMSTFQVNITKNTCGNGSSSFPNLLELQRKGTMDDYFTDAMRFIPASERACCSEFSRAGCLESFRAGRASISVDCHYQLAEKDERLMRTTLIMMENPITHDVEGVLYTLDLDRRQLFSNIFDQLFQKEYEGAAIINLRNGTYSLLQFKFDEGLIDKSQNLDYDFGLRRLAERFVAQEDRDRFLDGSALPVMLKHLEERSLYSFVCHFITPDGDTQLTKISFYFLNRRHDSILSVMEDITDITRREQRHVDELRAALTAAERATEARTTFLSNISHDMRTPLSGVLGFAHLAREADSLEEKNEEIDKIIASGDFLLQLINDTLDLSKIESNNMTLNPEAHDAASIIRDSVCAVEELARQKGVTLRVDTSKAEQMSILVDKLRLQQVYVNLLGNAIKFTPSGGMVVLTVERLAAEIKGANYRITVEDNGCGMSRDFIPHAFEAYSQQANVQTARAMGTGLGLAIVKRIVTMMGGFIELQSEEGKGARFDVYLPIVRAGRDAAVQDLAGPGEVSLEGRNILLCEDHAINRELAKRLLERRGMRVTAAEDGAQGLEAFRLSAPGFFDAVLMDIRMPNMDGITAAGAIRALAREDAKAVPIIALTANAFESDRQASMEAGMSAHLSKPIDPKELYATLMQTIGACGKAPAEEA